MVLETDKIRIELTKPDYLSTIIEIEKDNSNYIGQYDFSEHIAVIKSDNEQHLSIFDKSNNLLIGHVILSGLKNKNDSIEFRRIVVSRKEKGFGKESIKLIKEYCFQELRAHRIWLDVFENNDRAIGLYKSQGFKTKGLLRDSIKQNGHYRSLKIMSILANDSYSDTPLQEDHL